MTTDRKPQIAFLGIGLMGRPMASRLLATGHRLTAWNRSSGKAQALAVEGAQVAPTAGDAVSEADVIITMLADGAAVTDVLLAPSTSRRLGSNATVIDMSSIPPSIAREHAANLASRGVAHLDAPVSGGVRGATEGNLAIMAGGDPQVFEAMLPVLTILGRATLVGPSGSGQLAKLANQAIVAMTIGAVSEALLLAAAGGADPAKVREALLGGFADSTILRQHGERMLERQWAPGGPIRLQVKDLRTILAEAVGYELDLPIVSRVAALFEDAMSNGLAEYDHSALLLELERRNPGARVGSNLDQAPS